MNPQHTPTPWKYIKDHKRHGYCFLAGNGDRVITGTCYSDINISDEDAAFILRAVNAFDDMLKALKSAHQFSCGEWPGECKGQCNIAYAITRAEGSR